MTIDEPFDIEAEKELIYTQLGELILRVQTGEKLLPWPELSQDLAFLAFVIDKERER